ncbi:hypothetical protein [Clostridioides difficile]|uniref:hypothetical protein n=1 Tax=Clostridioides difficile TaxID=1496 RepID=UPI000D1F92B3|nr:hypothetical protein [Clostridioides difficile]HBE9444601.1 hypothetical protein [Clostridioides difficile]
MSDKNLILLTEDGVVSTAYFIKNNVYPTMVFFNIMDLIERMPYLTQNDHVLILIKGLCDFTKEEINLLCKYFDKIKDNIGSFVILSNIELNISEYYLYQDDLFYGKIKEVKNRMSYISNKNDKVSKKIINFIINKRNKDNIYIDKDDIRENIYNINNILKGYLVFNNKKDIDIFEKQNKTIFFDTDIEKEENNKYCSEIFKINLFK